MNYQILAINPGSTNTKIGWFYDDTVQFKETVEHKDLHNYPDILAQKDMRRQAVLEMIDKHGFSVTNLSAVVGRGGILPPVLPGAYRVNQRMKDLLQSGKLTPHASNLGALIADEIASVTGAGIPALVYDAVSAGEFPPIAQITGFPEIKRSSFCHVLNSRAVAHRYAASLGKKYAEMNLLIAHLGGGITVSVHQNGTIIDSLSDDNGPFSPERAGNVPLLEFVDMCYSGKYGIHEVKKKIRGAGGLKAHIGTADCLEIENMMRAGNEKAKLLLEAQAYQIAKGIGLLAPVLKGKCDAILITGGVAKSEFIMGLVKEYVDFIAKVVIIPGEYELEALAEGALRILRGEETVHEM
jgi:butyrate kinase